MCGTGTYSRQDNKINFGKITGTVFEDKNLDLINKYKKYGIELVGTVGSFSVADLEHLYADPYPAPDSTADHVPDPDPPTEQKNV